MSEHNCQDGCQGSYKPQRKIIVLKAKLAMILDERTIKNVNFAGILELGSLLAKNTYFFSSNPNYSKVFCNEMKNFPENRANLLCAINNGATEFAVFSCFKGKTTISQMNYALNKDVLNSFNNVELLDSFCDFEQENTLSFIPVPLNCMLIMKSISGILPYDFLLAKHYLGQYTKARKALSENDLDLISRIKEEGLSTLDDSYNDVVKNYLRIERKLFLQYEH
ncbi:MAG: hypothetical protein ACI4V7_02815 [Succinivibrionaceae bacterium]